jgi:carbon storage regulator
MLVLTRKLNEIIIIGKDIRIMVVEIHGKQVRLGIAAPADLAVTREDHQKNAGG